MAQNALLDRDETPTERNEFLHDLTDLRRSVRGTEVLAERDHLALLRYAPAPEAAAAAPRPVRPSLCTRWYDWGVAALTLACGASALACLLTLGH